MKWMMKRNKNLHDELMEDLWGWRQRAIENIITRFLWFLAGLFTGYLWMAKAYRLF